jgi:hypothetical protein
MQRMLTDGHHRGLIAARVSLLHAADARSALSPRLIVVKPRAPCGTEHRPMIAPAAELHALYPALHGLGAELAALVPQALGIPAGTVLFNENDPCKGFPLLLEGEVRVSRSSADGRSLELFDAATACA